MNSIESLKRDFQSQVKQLNHIHNDKIFDNCIYVGSGDSYVAGLIAQYLTDRKCTCYSPSDLFKSKFTKETTYCFISVTGKTKANIQVARHAGQARARTVAVTLNKESELARTCEQTVPLSITRTKTPTSGFGTFAANVVTCLQLAGIKVAQKFDIWHKNGVKMSYDLFESVTIPRQPLFILGNNILYALSQYASLQLAEFFGTTAIAHKLEEFCHSPIFGFQKSHGIWILGQDETKISDRLERLGLHLRYFELRNKDRTAQVFESIFFLQNLILLLAEKNGYTELHYVMKKDVLKASSDIIYGQTD